MQLHAAKTKLQQLRETREGSEATQEGEGTLTCSSKANLCCTTAHNLTVVEAHIQGHRCESDGESAAYETASDGGDEVRSHG